MKSNSDSEKLKERFNSHSTEKLIDIVNNRDAYTEIAVEIAKKTLTQRKVEIPDIEGQIKHEGEIINEEDILGVELPNGQIIFTGSQSLNNSENVGSRMDTIVDEINQREQMIEKDLVEKFTNSNNQELLNNYSLILEELTKKKVGKLPNEKKLMEYSHIIKIINLRELKIPSRMMEKHKTVQKLWTEKTKKEKRKKGVIRIIWGILTGMIGLFFLVASLESRRLMISFVTLIVIIIMVGKNFYVGFKLLGSK